jgi:TolB protein
MNMKKLSGVFFALLLLNVLVISQEVKVSVDFSIENFYSEKINGESNVFGSHKLTAFSQELFRYLRIVGKKNSIDFVENSKAEDIYTRFIIYFKYDDSDNSMKVECFQDKEVIFEANGKIDSDSDIERIIKNLSTRLLERISIIRLRFKDFDGMLRLTFEEAIDEYPSFSADGSLLAFISDRDTGNRDIYILDLNRMYVKRNSLAGSSEYFPRISSDNSKLVFQSTRGGKWGIWIQDMSELSDPESLKNIPVSGNSYTPNCGEDGVYFVQEEKGNTDIFFYEFLTEKVYKILESNEEEFSPYPSHMGIVFVRVKNDGDSGIYLLTSTGETKLLEDSPFNEFDPLVTEDDQWLIFSSNRDGVYRLWLKNLKSGVVYKLTTQEDGDAFYPTIKDDIVIFSMYSKGEPDLWALSINKYREIERRKNNLVDKIEKMFKLIKN